LSRAQGHAELPPEQSQAHRRAVRLEWLTIAYLLSAVGLLFLTTGSSQAGKAAFLEDLLSLLPPMAFLVAARFRARPPTRRFPYGYHRVVSIAYLAAAMALLGLGTFILYESAAKLVSAEHPPMGIVVPFGHPVWLGWLLIPALVWSAVPAVFLGRAKMPLAATLHDKVLYADAKMNKADWLTASAAIVGVLGIAVGWWWTDAVAAIVIALDIVHDGWTNLRRAVADLMDSRPTTYDGSGPHPLVAQLEREAGALAWVRAARVRLREEGHVFAGDVLIVPERSEDDLVEALADARDRLMALDWRLHDLVMVPVPELDERPEPAPTAAARRGVASG
jgi:cation diffusion facilitator family transporter